MRRVRPRSGCRPTGNNRTRCRPTDPCTDVAHVPRRPSQATGGRVPLRQARGGPARANPRPGSPGSRSWGRSARSVARRTAQSLGVGTHGGRRAGRRQGLRLLGLSTFPRPEPDFNLSLDVARAEVRAVRVTRHVSHALWRVEQRRRLLAERDLGDFRGSVLARDGLIRVIEPAAPGLRRISLVSMSIQTSPTHATW